MIIIHDRFKAYILGSDARHMLFRFMKSYTESYGIMAFALVNLSRKVAGVDMSMDDDTIAGNSEVTGRDDTVLDEWEYSHMLKKLLELGFNVKGNILIV